jgi:hypothetical protein
MGSEGLLNGLVLTPQDNPLPPFFKGEFFLVFHFLPLVTEAMRLR